MIKDKRCVLLVFPFDFGVYHHVALVTSRAGVTHVKHPKPPNLSFRSSYHTSCPEMPIFGTY